MPGSAYKNIFPPVDLADEDGLLCIGGQLNLELLLEAYRNGIFPWYNEGEPVCWFSPDPRFVLFPANLKISSSMKQLLKKDAFVFTINTAFKQVILNCRDVKRKGEYGTWIHDDIINSYCDLQQAGFAQSAEVWQNGKLVGGFYGILLGKIFCGESMFSLVSNASKYAFIKFVQHMRESSLQLVDCQVYSRHLESLGATMIKRTEFINLLRQYS